MAMETDRGHVVLRSHADGTTTLLVCAAVEDDAAVDVFARYVRMPSVRVDPRIRWVRAGSYRHTAEMVAVSSGDGTVNVHSLAHTREPLS